MLRAPGGAPGPISSRAAAAGATLGILGLLACGPAASSDRPRAGRAAKSAAPAAAPASDRQVDACSERSLRAFDPGVVVRARRLAPPRSVEETRGAEARREDVPCADDESDRACRERAEALAAEEAPEAQTVSAEIRRARAYRLRYEVDGAVKEKLFSSAEEGAAHLQALQKQGQRVQPLSGVAAEEEGGARRAVVTVTIDPGRRVEVVERRVELEVEAPEGEAPAALQALQERAEAAELAVERWELRPDSAALVVLTCTDRP